MNHESTMLMVLVLPKGSMVVIESIHFIGDKQEIDLDAYDPHVGKSCRVTGSCKKPTRPGVYVFEGDSVLNGEMFVLDGTFKLQPTFKEYAVFATNHQQKVAKIVSIIQESRSHITDNILHKMIACDLINPSDLDSKRRRN